MKYAVVAIFSACMGLVFAFTSRKSPELRHLGYMFTGMSLTFSILSWLN